MILQVEFLGGPLDGERRCVAFGQDSITLKGHTRKLTEAEKQQMRLRSYYYRIEGHTAVYEGEEEVDEQ